MPEANVHSFDISVGTPLFDHLIGGGEQGGRQTSPSAVAAFRLMIVANLVGVCTASSLGFSPLRIRWTYPAARR